MPRRFWERALAARERVLGQEHPDTRLPERKNWPSDEDVSPPPQTAAIGNL